MQARPAKTGLSAVPRLTRSMGLFHHPPPQKKIKCIVSFRTRFSMTELNSQPHALRRCYNPLSKKTLIWQRWHYYSKKLNASEKKAAPKHEAAHSIFRTKSTQKFSKSILRSLLKSYLGCFPMYARIPPST